MQQTEQRATKPMASYKIPFLRGCRLASVIAALGLAAPAVAQQTPPTPQQPPQAPVKLVEKAKHGDWSVTCPKPNTEQNKQKTTENNDSGKGDLESDESADEPLANCFMVQAARHSEKKDLAVSVMVFKNVVKGKTVSQLRVNVPAQFYVLLPAGIGLEIDGDSANAQQLQYMFCPPPGLCIAVKELNEDLLAKLKAGSTTKLYVWDVRRRGAIFELSLKGFTAAYEEL